MNAFENERKGATHTFTSAWNDELPYKSLLKRWLGNVNAVTPLKQQVI